MAEQFPAKRKYDSSRRKEKARQTERDIVEAARRLFLTRGYAGTTIEQIAQEAGVATETVYATFGSKRAVLAKLVSTSVLGGDEPVPLMDQPGPQAVRRETDQRRQIELFAADIAGRMERVGPLFGVMRSAAETEPDISELLNGVLAERLRGVTVFPRVLAANGPLRGGMTVEEAGETAWAITSAEVRHLLRVDRGWSLERYVAWLSDTLERLLLE